MALTPVLIGLAVGIAFIVLFAAMFAYTDPNFSKRHYLDITVDGLKESYDAGERIDFTIKAKGFEQACGFPDVRIVDEKGNEKSGRDKNVVDLMGGCDPEARDIDENWALAQMGVRETGLLEGSYKVIVEYGKHIVEKEFQVVQGEPVFFGDIPGTTLCASSLCTYYLGIDNNIYPVNFRFNGAIENMTNDPKQSLTVTLEAPSDGNLEIAIPRELVNPTDGTQDVDFAVFADEINVAAFEHSTKDTKWAEALGIGQNPERYRILVIPISQGTETVEIVGTWLI